MRKTSHDGIDATSITSSIENEIKKASTNINKIKKSSIKRKVQNFSHESDDGIIEPLLQIDKEKSEIANRSAKYLLNKSKTDSYERINKISENFSDKDSISTIVSPTSKIVNSSEKENQISPLNTQGTAPIHNHMNTNIFGTYDVSKAIITTKSPILVEIDGCKPNVYSPNPLIFTTAKIHTDGTTKLMEPVHVTPVPILSTIEGNVVKTVANNIKENNTSNNAVTKSVDLFTNIPCKSDVNEFQSKGQTESHTNYLNESQSKSKTDQSFIGPINNSDVCTKNQNLSSLSNNISKNIILPNTTGSINIQTKIAKVELQTESIPSKSIETLQKSTTPSIVTSSSGLTSTSSSQKTLTEDKKKRNVINENKDLNVKVQLPLDLKRTDDSSKKIKSPQTTQEDINDKVTLGNKISPMYVETSHESKSKIVQSVEHDLSNAKDNFKKDKMTSSGSKRLQRQKNAALEEVTDVANSISSLDEKIDRAQDLSKKSVINNEKIDVSKGQSQSPQTTVSVLTPSTKMGDYKPTAPIVPKTTENITSKTLNNSDTCHQPLNKSSIVTSLPTAKDLSKITPSTSSIKSQSSVKTITGKSSVTTASGKTEAVSSKLPQPSKSLATSISSKLDGALPSSSKSSVTTTRTKSVTAVTSQQNQISKSIVTAPSNKSDVSLPLLSQTQTSKSFVTTSTKADAAISKSQQSQISKSLVTATSSKTDGPKTLSQTSKSSVPIPSTTAAVATSLSSMQQSQISKSFLSTSGNKLPSLQVNKQDHITSSQSSKSDGQGKIESPVIPTTLPAYIVSTSKTKIGSTLTSNTVTNTSKTQTQKPKSEVVYTPIETFKIKPVAQQSDKPTGASSSSNGTKQSNVSQTKQKLDKNKKDGRA